jgi:phage shock protein A
LRAQDDWYRRAQLAVEKGDDELAKEALKRRKSNQENADTMRAQLEQQRKAVDQLISNTKCARAHACDCRHTQAEPCWRPGSAHKPPQSACYLR